MMSSSIQPLVQQCEADAAWPLASGRRQCAEVGFGHATRRGGERHRIGLIRDGGDDLNDGLGHDGSLEREADLGAEPLAQGGAVCRGLSGAEDDSANVAIGEIGV
jgi:hypothetical protein